MIQLLMQPDYIIVNGTAKIQLKKGFVFFLFPAKIQLFMSLSHTLFFADN